MEDNELTEKQKSLDAIKVFEQMGEIIFPHVLFEMSRIKDFKTYKKFNLIYISFAKKINSPEDIDLKCDAWNDSYYEKVTQRYFRFKHENIPRIGNSPAIFFVMARVKIDKIKHIEKHDEDLTLAVWLDNNKRSTFISKCKNLEILNNAYNRTTAYMDKKLITFSKTPRIVTPE